MIDVSAEATPVPAVKLHAFSWVVLAGAVLQLTFSPGPIIFGAWGMLAPALTDLVHTNRGGIMLALTAFNIGAIVAAPFTGKLIDWVGVRLVLLGSLLCLIGGFVIIAFGVHSLWQLYAVAFLWGILTLGSQSISYTKLLTGWFTKNRGLALGVAAAGLGLGYTLVPLLTAWALAVFGWQGALLALAAAVAIGPLLISVPLAAPPVVDIAVKAVETSTVSGMTLTDTLRTRSFWYLASAVFLISIALTGMTPHIFLLARELRFGPAEATSAAAAYGLATIFGRLVAGLLFDRFSAPKVCSALFGCAVIGFTILALMIHGMAPTPLIFVAILLLGLGFGAETDVIGFLTAAYYGQRAFGQIYGCLLSAFVLGAALGPPLLGYGHDAFGGYGLCMWAAAVICLAAVILALRLPSQAIVGKKVLRDR